MASARGYTPLLLAVLACYFWGAVAVRATEVASDAADVGIARIGGDHMMLQVRHNGRIESMMQVSNNATQGPSCCPGCAGHGFCSPKSYTCYDDKNKDYYRTCPTQEPTPAPTPAPNDVGSATCCGGCASRNYCSPMSSRCYDRKFKDYYQACPTQNPTPAPTPTPDDDASSTCCGGCAGRNYCSPVSGRCYDNQHKPYYAQCGGDGNPGSSLGDGPSLQACRGPGNMRVKMLTYNLFWWNLFGRRGGNGGSAGKLVRDAAHGEPFDVVGFQECDNPGWIMGDAGMHDEYDYVRWGSNSIAFRKARWAMRANGHEFTAEDRSDQYYGRRGVQWIRLHDTASNGTVFFIHTHGPLPVNTGGRFGGEAAAHGILGVISRQAGPDDSIMLTGDFNAEAHSSTVRTLQDRIHHVMTDWVDHIFTNCNTGVVETRNLGNGGSDHDALMGIFTF